MSYVQNGDVSAVCQCSSMLIARAACKGHSECVNICTMQPYVCACVAYYSRNTSQYHISQYCLFDRVSDENVTSSKCTRGMCQAVKKSRCETAPSRIVTRWNDHLEMSRDENNVTRLTDRILM